MTYTKAPTMPGDTGQMVTQRSALHWDRAVFCDQIPVKFKKILKFSQKKERKGKREKRKYKEKKFIVNSFLLT